MSGTWLFPIDAKDKEEASSILKLLTVYYAKQILDWHPRGHFSIKIRSIYSLNIH